MHPSSSHPAHPWRAGFDRLDRRITVTLAAVAIPVLRVALGVVFLVSAILAAARSTASGAGIGGLREGDTAHGCARRRPTDDARKIGVRSVRAAPLILVATYRSDELLCRPRLATPSRWTRH